jgi:Domain of unknown function (DUF4268)
MSKTNLGRLEKVSLREVWSTESVDFTPWLAHPENLKLLGETIGIELECEAQEKEVGPFRADILCKDTTTGNWVLVENQLERTDHTHLGQLLTYAAGLDAVTIVWITERFTEEHRAALDWLNEKTEKGINFFGLEMELWRIGGSPIAPKFNIVSEPNEWSRTVRDTASGDLTEAKRIQLNFWTAFKDFMDEKGRIPCSKPNPQSWMNHSIGMTGARLSSVASMWNSATNSYSIPEIGVHLVLDGKTSKEVFGVLEARKTEIEAAIGLSLTWSCPTDARVCRIYTRKDEDFRNQKLWAEQHRWLSEALERFNRVFRPLLKELGESVADAKKISA